MVNTKQRVAKRRKALNDIQNLVGNASNLLIIHYSCESFYDIKDGRTPRITSIAVRFLILDKLKHFLYIKLLKRKGF